MFIEEEFRDCIISIFAVVHRLDSAQGLAGGVLDYLRKELGLESTRLTNAITDSLTASVLRTSC